MPSVLILKEGNTLALYGLGNDGCRLFGLSGLFKSGQYLGYVMPIDSDCIPAKSFELFLVSIQVVSVHGGIGLPQPVDVQYGTQVIKTGQRGLVCCLPNSSLSTFPIPHHDINPPWAFSQFHSHGQSHSDRKTLSERTGRSLDPLHPGCGMPL